MGNYSANTNLEVPAADAIVNETVKDVVGNKTDTAVAVVGTTKTLLGYIKGLVNRLDKHKTPHIARSGASGTSYVDMLDVTNKGVLKSVVIQVATPNTNIWNLSLQVVIDGASIFAGKVFGVNYTTDVGLNGYVISLPLDFQFETSCKVSLKADTAGRYFYAVCAYTTD